jgi:hypothetical protein
LLLSYATGLSQLLKHAVLWHNSSSGSSNMLQQLGVQLMDSGELSSSSSSSSRGLDRAALESNRCCVRTTARMRLLRVTLL